MRRVWCLAAILLAAGTGTASGVSLRAGSATVARSGDVADLCVKLDSGGARVAGTQNDLVWDGSCATLPSESSCRINPATGKNLSARIQNADFDIKLIVLSFSNVNPIPDGALYCCAFRVEADPGTCCPVSVRDALASDPAGNALATSGNTANLCVQTNPFDPTPTPDDSFGFSSGTGCQTAPPVATGMGGAALVPAALLLAARRLVSGWRAGRALRPRRRGR